MGIIIMLSGVKRPFEEVIDRGDETIILVPSNNKDDIMKEF